MREHIRPDLARRENELIHWFEYGLKWGDKELGLAILVTYTGPEAKKIGNPAENERALRDLLPELQDPADRAAIIELEDRLGLPEELRRESEATLALVGDLRAPFDRDDYSKCCMT